MKRVIPILFILLLLTGCEVKEYTPEIPDAFTQKAKVMSGDFSFECEICKKVGEVITTVTSTSAEGMVMTYDGFVLNFNYGEYSCDIDGDGFERSNISIVIYEVFDSLISLSQPNAKKIENGYQYYGKTSLGDFVLIQNENNTLRSLSIKSANLEIEFL